MNAQLGFAFCDAMLSPDPSTNGRAVRQIRREQLQQDTQTEEQPAIAVDFTQRLSPAEMADVRSYADTVVPQLQDRAATLYEDPDKQAHYLRKYAAGMALAAARALALADRMATAAPVAVEPSAEAVSEQEKPKAPKPRQEQPKAEKQAKQPPGARDPRTPPGPWSPRAPKRQVRVEEDESHAPVPAAPRKPQPTADAVLAMRPARPPRRVLGGGE